jgi:hypothetical protein
MQRPTDDEHWSLSTTLRGLLVCLKCISHITDWLRWFEFELVQCHCNSGTWWSGLEYGISTLVGYLEILTEVSFFVVARG